MFNAQFFFESGRRRNSALELVMDTSKGTGTNVIIPIYFTGTADVLDWGDGTQSGGYVNHPTHTYAVDGIYTIKVKANISRIWFQGDSDNAKKLIRVKSWGSNVMTTFLGSFGTCSNLMLLPDIPPDTKLTTSFQSAFQNDVTFNQNLSYWDMSGATSIRDILNGCTAYNINIDWMSLTKGTINVTDMSGAFNGTKMQSIKMQAGKITTAISLGTFLNCPNLSELILKDLGVSINISVIGPLQGVKINEMGNNVKDMTGKTAPTVTMSAAQKASCDQTIWTNKNWIIA